MSDRVLDIDHLMIHVPEAGKAGDAFASLGFTVTPLSAMPGLVNRLVCFPDTNTQAGMCNYIELMGLTDANAAPPPMPELLGNGFGPVSMVMSVDDAKAVRERLMAEGIKLGPVIDLERDWQLPSGEIISPAFAVGILELGQAPFCWNYCQHKTPQHYVRKEFTQHANGIKKLNAIVTVHDEPMQAAQHYTRHWNATATGTDPVAVQMATVALEIYTPAAFERAFGVERKESGLSGIRLGATDIAVAREHMSRDGIDLIDIEGGFLIRPEQAVNTLLIIEQYHAGAW